MSEEQKSIRVRGRTLNIGEPNLRHTVAGKEVKITDAYGLPADPQFYAKANCSACRGAGIIVGRRAITAEDVRKRGLHPATKGQLVTYSATCGCTRSTYALAVSKLQETQVGAEVK